MDRSDELKDHRVLNSTRDDEDSVVRDEGILGITGSPVPKSPGDPVASNDPESVRHRHARAMHGAEDVHTATEQHSGATGIDMGAGGQGTDLSGE
jgi:hypothetical protein